MRHLDGNDPYWYEYRGNIIHFECEGNHDECLGYAFDIRKSAKMRVPVRVGIARMKQHYRPPMNIDRKPIPDEPPF